MRGRIITALIVLIISAALSHASGEIYMYRDKNGNYVLTDIPQSTTSIQEQEVHGRKGTVVKVKDGDTVVIKPGRGGQFYVCRLYGIDAPETPKPYLRKPGQPFGEEATRFLKSLILGRNVTVVTTGEKTYNREVCLIYKDNDFINLLMVKYGYAWAYRKYLREPYLSMFIKAENYARRHRLGLWEQTNPVPPWDFRHAKMLSIHDKSTDLTVPVCERKQYCYQMDSCEEAMFYFETCNIKSLDGDGDGIPCENLCQ